MRNQSLYWLAGCLILFSCEKQEKTGVGENSPPVITDAEILPPNPSPNSRISLRIDAYDRDGDQIEYEIWWFLNEGKVSTGKFFSAQNLKKGDKIYAVITPSDGKTKGESFETSSRVVGNSPPEITGARLLPENISSITRKIEIIPEAYDPDGDPLSFIAEWVIEGSKLPDSTLVVSGVSLKKGQELRIGVKAFDGSLYSKEVWTLRTTVSNAPPQFNFSGKPISISENINFRVPIKDPDGDSLIFELISAPSGISLDKKTGILTGRVPENIDTLFITVRAEDTEGAYIEPTLRFRVK